MSGDKSASREIVIVRRHGHSEDEGHHGGAWKIAYADFMTAMMAFFLVMWLVNAADKKVLTQVARYFNPLPMSDRVTASKGLDDLVNAGKQPKGFKDGEKDLKGSADTAGKAKDDHHNDKDKSAEEEHESKSKKEEAGGVPGGKTHFTEQELFNDPYGILEKLAASVAVGGKEGQKNEAGVGPEASKAIEFQDPFEPEFLKKKPRLIKDGSQSPSAFDVAASEKEVTLDGASEAQEKDSKDSAIDAPREPEAAHTSDTTQEASKDASREALARSKAEAERISEEIATALADLSGNEQPSVTIQATPEGVLISLTDDLDFEMFDVSSASPNARLVVALKRIAPVLARSQGGLVVRGHTDARKFKSKTSDNWRLSTQRALIARYTLTSGGIEDKRFVRIEGLADTKPTIEKDPLAPQNRRIEILLQREKV